MSNLLVNNNRISRSLVRVDTEIINLWELLTNKKKGLFNFGSKNNIKKNNFNKFLQKLVDRLMDLKGYCKKYGIKEIYLDEYFFELLLLFNDIIEKNNESKIHIDILYDLKRFISINYRNILSDSYKYYVDKFKNFLRKTENPRKNINASEFKSFIKSLSNNSTLTKIVFKNNLHQNRSRLPNKDIFLKKYEDYKNFIDKIKQLITQARSQNNVNNTLNELNKDMEKNIEQLKQNIELLDKKLKEKKEQNINWQRKRNEEIKRMYTKSEKAEKERENTPPIEPVPNWTSMYFKGNQYNPPEELPTDPNEIEKAKKRFERISEKKRLKSIAGYCSNYRQEYTQEEYKKCSNAVNILKKMNEENNPKTVLNNSTLDRIGRMR